VRWTEDDDLPAGSYPPAWLVHFRRTLAAFKREDRLRQFQHDNEILAEARRIEKERARMAEGSSE
jgi:hypothetical protein